MLNRDQFRGLIERITSGLPFETNRHAVDLLLGTAAQESEFGHYLRQLGNGPARGFFQMEPATEEDIWNNYLAFRPPLRSAVYLITGRSGPGPWLEWDVAYQIVMARLQYRRAPGAVPETLQGQAEYWKDFYNTAGGKGTVSEYLENWELYVS